MPCQAPCLVFYVYYCQSFSKLSAEAGGITAVLWVSAPRLREVKCHVQRCTAFK